MANVDLDGLVVIKCIQIQYDKNNNKNEFNINQFEGRKLYSDV